MKHTISKLESILAQATSSNTPQCFFVLLHEFALELQNPKFYEALKTILAKKNEMERWINQMPHKPSPELKDLYSSQYRMVSVWYSLNQIFVFYERYDFGFHDVVIQKLIQKNRDTRQLKDEHSEMMKYVITGICPKIFPTIEEYKHYMRRITDSLKEIAGCTIQELTVRPFRFDKESNALLIEGFEPIKFTRNKNTSLLMGFLEEKKWKSVTWTTINKQLGFECDTTKRTIRQINDRIPAFLQPFLNTPNHQAELYEKIITVSGFYKKQ